MKGSRYIFSFLGLLILLAGGWWLTGRREAASRLAAPADARRMVAYAADYSKTHDPDLPQAKRLRSLRDTLYTDRQGYSAITEYARAMMGQGRQVDVFELFSSLTPMLDPDEKDMAKVSFLINMYVLQGSAADETGMSNLSIEYYTRGLGLAERTSQRASMPRFYNNLGVCYYRLGDYKSAEAYFKRALDLNRSLNLNYDVFLNYNNLAEVALEHSQLDSALDYALKALQYLNGADTREQAPGNMEGYIQGLIASIYIKKGEYHIARSYVENAINLQADVGMTSDLFSCYLTNSELFLKEEKPDSALFWADKALGLLTADDLKMRADALKRLSEIEQDEGNDAEALEYLRASTQLADSLSNIEKVKRMEQCQQIYEMDSRRRARQAEELMIPDWVVFTLTSLSALVIAVTVLWLMRRRYLRRVRALEQSLRQLQGEYTALQQSVRSSELEQQSAQELSYRQLTNYTIQNMRIRRQSDETVMEIRRLLNDGSMSTKELRSSLKDIVNQVTIGKSGDDWTEFNYYFERVSTSFYRNLLSVHPDITEKQRRLCALLSLGLNTKEIAQVMCREVRSIESSRTRLRKKLGLDESVNLNQYFRRFAEPAQAADETHS